MSQNNLQKAIVKVDPASFHRYSRSITGIVAVQIGEIFYPESNWSDFPVVILGWWLEPVHRILQGKTRDWECRFMDGPLSVRLVQEQEDIWTLKCCRDTQVKFSTSVSCRAFIRSVLGAADETLQECCRRSWQDRDTDALASDLRTIQWMWPDIAQPPTPGTSSTMPVRKGLRGPTHSPE